MLLCSGRAALSLAKVASWSTVICITCARSCNGDPMLALIARRVIAIVPILFGVSVVTFLLMRPFRATSR